MIATLKVLIGISRHIPFVIYLFICSFFYYLANKYFSVLCSVICSMYLSICSSICRGYPYFIYILSIFYGFENIVNIIYILSEHNIMLFMLYIRTKYKYTGRCIQ